VDSQLQGIKMHLCESQCKFPAHDVEEAKFEITRLFDTPTLVHLNRFVISFSPICTSILTCYDRPITIVLQDCGVKKEALMDL
jgi:hypothetical protein